MVEQRVGVPETIIRGSPDMPIILATDDINNSKCSNNEAEEEESLARITE
jgi:hypothetical protein